MRWRHAQNDAPADVGYGRRGGARPSQADARRGRRPTATIARPTTAAPAPPACQPAPRKAQQTPRAPLRARTAARTDVRWPLLGCRHWTHAWRVSNQAPPPGLPTGSASTREAAPAARRRRRLWPRPRAPTLIAPPLVLALVAPAAARGDTATFTPTADARVEAGTPSANFGSNRWLKAGASPRIHS